MWCFKEFQPIHYHQWLLIFVGFIASRNTFSTSSYMQNPIRQYLPDTSLPSPALQNRKSNVTRKYCEGRYMNRLNSRGTGWAGHSFYSSLLLLLFSSLVLSCFLVLDTFPNSLIPRCLSVVVRSFFLSNSRSPHPCSLLLPHLHRLRLLSLFPSLKINLVHRIPHR
jgi:hypothetical protein